MWTKLVPKSSLSELRIQFPSTSSTLPSSFIQYITSEYPKWKSEFPRLPILLREYTAPGSRDVTIYGRFGFGLETKCTDIHHDMSAAEIEQHLKSWLTMSIDKDSKGGARRS